MSAVAPQPFAHRRTALLFAGIGVLSTTAFWLIGIRGRSAEVPASRAPALEHD
jgi:hypothetical protein